MGLGRRTHTCICQNQIWIGRERNKYGYIPAKQFDGYITIHFN